MPKRILVVDDEPDSRRSIRCALETIGLVSEASSGAEALASLRDQPPSAMLLDVSMPGMGGLAVLQAALDLIPALAVIMLTGEMDLGVAREALERGARSYVTKPFDVEALRTEIRRLLEPAKTDGGEEGGRPWRIAGG